MLVTTEPAGALEIAMVLETYPPASGIVTLPVFEPLTLAPRPTEANASKNTVAKTPRGISFVFIRIGFLRRSLLVPNRRGVTYSRPNSGTGMPSTERFQARPSGRASKAVR